MMDTKNALTKGQSASLSVGADTNASSLTHPANQANPAKPFVAIYPEPGNKLDRFLVQGYVDTNEIGLAAQALIDLLDSIHGDPDFEDDDDDTAVDDMPCDPLQEGQL